MIEFFLTSCDLLYAQWSKSMCSRSTTFNVCKALFDAEFMSNLVVKVRGRDALKASCDRTIAGPSSRFER